MLCTRSITPFIFGCHTVAISRSLQGRTIDAARETAAREDPKQALRFGYQQ